MPCGFCDPNHHSLASSGQGIVITSRKLPPVSFDRSNKCDGRISLSPHSNLKRSGGSPLLRGPTSESPILGLAAPASYPRTRNVPEVEGVDPVGGEEVLVRAPAPWRFAMHRKRSYAVFWQWYVVPWSRQFRGGFGGLSRPRSWMSSRTRCKKIVKKRFRTHFSLLSLLASRYSLLDHRVVFKRRGTQAYDGRRQLLLGGSLQEPLVSYPPESFLPASNSPRRDRCCGYSPSSR